MMYQTYGAGDVCLVEGGVGGGGARGQQMMYQSFRLIRDIQ